MHSQAIYNKRLLLGYTAHGSNFNSETAALNEILLQP